MTQLYLLKFWTLFIADRFVGASETSYSHINTISVGDAFYIESGRFDANRFNRIVHNTFVIRDFFISA